jgi:hypothetical protein
MRLRGARKNLLITVWLLLPVAVVGGLTWWIFHTYTRPKAMNAVPVGAGAGDTGGANALGEWLAGNDPDEIRREKRVEAEEKREAEPTGEEPHAGEGEEQP